jgi:two-component system, cell cycle sensor histidine kinase and response regulator CckA
MTEPELKRRDDVAGVPAPTIVLAALPLPFVSAVADALRDASFVVAQAPTLDETGQALAQSSCAVLVLCFPLEPSFAEWLSRGRQQLSSTFPPVLLLSDQNHLEDAQANSLGDLAIATDAPCAAFVQSVRVLARIALSERRNCAGQFASLPPPNPAESDWSAIVAALPFGFLIVDDSDRIVDGNATAANLLAMSFDQLIGANLSSVLGDSGVLAGLRAAPSDASWIAGDFARTRNDEILELEYVARRAVSPGKHVVVLVDVTARNGRETLQHRAKKMDSLGRLVGGMAHEFNNLLTVILGYSDLSVRLAPPDGKFSEALAQIKNSAERGAQLTQLLLAFGRKQVMAPAWVDLNLLLVNLEDHIRKIVGENVTVNIPKAPALPPVFIDPMLVQRALVQIVTNARDVLPKNGILTLSTYEFVVTSVFARYKPELRPGRYVCLSIQDNGPGIPSDIKPFVFEPFFTTKSVGKGTGMGLAFVDGVMHQSGGSVDVVSEPGEGATVRLFFSTVNTLTNEPQPAPPESSIAPTNATILLVDDDDGVRRFGSLVLRAHGYQVLEASDGAEALALVEKKSTEIDLVITDVIMPVMGGIELGNRLAALRPGLPILYQSGRLEDLRQTEGSLERNLLFLTKPFTREAFLAKVSQLLNK